MLGIRLIILPCSIALISCLLILTTRDLAAAPILLKDELYAEILSKRSPLPEPKRGGTSGIYNEEIPGTSTFFTGERFLREEEESDEEYNANRAIVNPSNHYALMQQLLDAYTLQTEGEERLERSAKKWLDRMEATVMRNEELITEQINHYNTRSHNRRNAARRERARRKKVLWQAVRHAEVDRSMQRLVLTTHDRYLRSLYEINHQILLQRGQNEHQSIDSDSYRALTDEYNLIRNLFNTFPHPDAAQALTSAEIELERLLRVWNASIHDPQLPHQAVLEQEANVIAWNQKMRLANVDIRNR